MIWRSLTCFSLAALTLEAASVMGMVALKDSRLDAVNKRRDYSGIVISLEPVGPQPAAPPKAPPPATMLEKKQIFTPPGLPGAPGPGGHFPNPEPNFHNAFS